MHPTCGVIWLCRGATAGAQDKARVSALIYDLECFRSDAAGTESLDGTWRLVWSSVEPFRSSPFFWAFIEGLVQNRAIAARIFKFTDRLASHRATCVVCRAIFTPCLPLRAAGRMHAG